jgi:rhodanese-related sulfurtransferase
MQPITAQQFLELKKKHPNLLLLDVREKHEYDAKRIQDSVHIPITEIPHHQDNLKGHPLIVTHCRSGGRAKETAKYLDSIGCQEVYYLTTFIDDWEKEGLKVQAGVKKKFSLENLVFLNLGIIILIPSILGLHHPNWLYVPIALSSLLIINSLLKQSILQYFNKRKS